MLHTCYNLFQLPPHCHLHINCMAYKNTLAFPIRLMTLMLFFQSPIAHHWQATSYSSKSAGNFWQSKVLLQDCKPIPPHHMHTPNNAGHEILPCDVWFGKFPHFIFYYIACKLALCFFSSSVQTQQFTFLILGNIHAWGYWKTFGWSLFYQLLFCSFHLCSFASATMNFLAAL